MFQQCDCEKSFNLRAGLGDGPSSDWAGPSEAELCRSWIEAGFIPDGVSAPAHCAQYAPMPETEVGDRVFSPLPPQPENGITRPAPTFAPMPAPAAPAAPMLLIPSQSELDRAREMNRIRDEEAERIRLQNLANEQSRFSQGFRPTFREGDWGQVRTTPTPAASPMPAPAAAPAPAPVTMPARVPDGGAATGGGMGDEMILRALPYFPDGEPLPNWPGDAVPAVMPEAPKVGGIGGLLALAVLAVSLLR